MTELIDMRIKKWASYKGMRIVKFSECPSSNDEDNLVQKFDLGYNDTDILCASINDILYDTSSNFFEAMIDAYYDWPLYNDYKMQCVVSDNPEEYLKSVIDLLSYAKTLKWIL